MLCLQLATRKSTLSLQSEMQQTAGQRIEANWKTTLARANRTSELWKASRYIPGYQKAGGVFEKEREHALLADEERASINCVWRCDPVGIASLSLDP